MNLTWRRNIPEASSLSLPISHVSSNKGALLPAIRLVWPQCSCDVLLLGSYSHFQCCIGMTLRLVTAWFGVQISSLHVHTLGMVFACSEFCGQLQANINKPRKKFSPCRSRALLWELLAQLTNAHGSSCHAVDDKQMLSFITEYLTVLNPTPLSLQTVMWILCLSTFVCVFHGWLCCLFGRPLSPLLTAVCLIYSPRTFQYVSEIHLRSWCIVSRFH